MTLPGDVLETRELADVTRPDGPDLIELLEARAIGDQISGAELSRRIGIDQALWSRVRRGQERFGVETCAKIVARYPDLRQAAVGYLGATRPQGPTALALLEEAGQIARDAQRKAS